MPLLFAKVKIGSQCLFPPQNLFENKVLKIIVYIKICILTVLVFEVFGV